MGHSQLAVYVDEHLGFQYLIQARLIDKIEVKDGSALVCKTIRKTRKTSLAKKGTNQRKNSNHKHKHKLMGIEYIKGGRGDFQIVNLNLKPHLVSLLSGRGGHRATPPR